jgi:hypothetical protein
MAWAWWLLAPVLSTAAGGLVLWWHGRSESCASTLRPGIAIAQHRALLDALTRPGETQAQPVNMVLLPTSADKGGAANR